MLILGICFFGISFASGGWKLVYENDAFGNPVQGDINELIEMVRNGVDIKVNKVIPGLDQIQRCMIPVVSSSGKIPIVSCVSDIQPSLNNTADAPAKFLDDRYFYMVAYSTVGFADAIRYPGNHTQSHMSVKWYANIGCDNLVPLDQIAMFDATTCPDGWRRYFFGDERSDSHSPIYCKKDDF